MKLKPIKTRWILAQLQNILTKYDKNHGFLQVYWSNLLFCGEIPNVLVIPSCIHRPRSLYPRLIPFRWAAGGLEICWINFTSTPSPPKKTDRKHQLSLLCEGFCNITSILLGGCYTPFTKGFTFPNWLPNVISARFKQKLYDLHVTWILMERIDGSFSSGKKGKPGNSISTLWL